MTKNEELEQLFEKWKSNQNNETNDSLQETLSSIKLDKGSFIKDGIICEDEFEKQKIKVLFISNEANIQDDILNGKIKCNADRREEFNNYYKSGNDEWPGKLRKRISALYKAFTNQNEVTCEVHKLANKFAFMNLNKRGGMDETNKIAIIPYCNTYKKEILKEIEIINPDIIVWCACNTFFIAEKILGANSTKINEIKTMDINKKTVAIVKAYHTSYYQSKLEPINNFEQMKLNKICGKQLRYLFENLKKLVDLNDNHFQTIIDNLNQFQE